MTNEEIAALVLPWARDNQPKPYAQTIAVSRTPTTFRAYLLRLIEIRWSLDASWRFEVPLRVLEETAVAQKMRHRPTGQEFEMQGRLDPATRTPRQDGRRYAWGNLADAIEAGIDFAMYFGLIQDWNLEVEP